MGLLKAMLDAIHNEDNRIAGVAVTRLTAQLAEDDTTDLSVESTIGFGEDTDGLADAKLLINGEIVYATGRLNGPTTFKFTGLTRGVVSSTVRTHPPGTLVYDLSRNKSALDLVRRGLFVSTALAEDLNIIGRNLGLHRCSGIDDETWRRLIKAMAYLPKTTVQAFELALTALYDNTTSWEVNERLISDPYKVFVNVSPAVAAAQRGHFYLNGGETALTTGGLSVDTDYLINNVIGVYDDTPLTRRGWREGFTNYYSGGSFLGSTITLGSSPGAAGTPVIVDYGAFRGHSLALDTTLLDDEDFYPYLADPLSTVRCVLNQVRAAGVKVELGFLL